MARKTTKQPTQTELLQDVAQPTSPIVPTPAVTGVRRAIDDQVAGGWTPSKLARVLANARALSDTAAYFSLAEEIEERDLNYRSVIGTRKLAVAGLPFSVEPSAADGKVRAKKVAAFVQRVLNSEVVRGSLYALADAISKGVSVCRIDWNYGTEWTPAAIEWVDSRWLTFDKTDGRTVLLQPAIMGGKPEPLQPYRFIVHTPQLKTGLPIRSGLAASAAWLYVARGIAMRDWLGFIELYGQPVRLGYYKAGTRPEDLKVLKQAVASIGTDAAAVLPDSMKVEFAKDASVTGSADAYEKLCRYCDEVVAKLVLGGSLTSGTSGGGSYALGQVHNEVRADLLKADAAALTATIMRDLVAPLVALNFGTDVPLPGVALQVEEAEDLAALVEAVAKLVPLGLQVSQDELRGRLRLRAPADGEAVLEAAALPVAAAANSLTAGCPVHGVASHAAQKDSLDLLADDMLDGWAVATQDAHATLLAAAANSTSIDDMRAALVQAINQADPTALAEFIGGACVKARATAHTEKR